MLIRPAALVDLPAILDIYNEVISHSTAVYCDDPVTLAERQAWFAARQEKGFPVLVACETDKVIGYASFGDFRSFPGYRYTVEHSVHLAPPARGKGVGAQLVNALLPLARDMGKHVMVGAVDAANEGSIRFHQRLGFSEVARMPEVGFKFGRWLDLVMLQRVL
ncbi:MAG: N-acetyltransferase [Paludibacterium sp.]|uniref:GNAT family N-acetyltransferase n=1 Tax=Paludibacterium sp. TaxID=1917523 RepID=UPI0025CD6C7F|nr:GNAT family N-acetyltransferase [Paludibacterium sp.]MBV8046237.1 N-acetyltransferase [Paludibacterium sp.]MBV8649443.1 N-acetyltransferase [Paludibacterium sp.]